MLCLRVSGNVNSVADWIESDFVFVVTENFNVFSIFVFYFSLFLISVDGVYIFIV